MEKIFDCKKLNIKYKTIVDKRKKYNIKPPYFKKLLLIPNKILDDKKVKTVQNMKIIIILLHHLIFMENVIL